MSRWIWNGLKRGTKAMLQGKTPASFAAGGKQVRCPHCGSDRFHDRRILLNTAGMTYIGLDWANKEATALTCGRCSMIQWFREPPERIDVSTAAKPPEIES